MAPRNKNMRTSYNSIKCCISDLVFGDMFHIPKPSYHSVSDENNAYIFLSIVPLIYDSLEYWNKYATYSILRKKIIILYLEQDAPVLFLSRPEN